MEAYTRVAQNDAFEASRQKFEELAGQLGGEGVLRMRHDELETLVERQGREVLRQMLQDHLELRARNEQRQEQVKGADGVERRQVRQQQRELMTVLGPVRVERTGYGAKGSKSLMPMDEQLNLPLEVYSHEVRKRVAQEVARGAYEGAVEAVESATGAQVPKRQAEQLAARAAVDFDAFYGTRRAASAEQEANTGELVVITADGKGVPMLKEHLREPTRKAAEKQEHKLSKRLSRGEKRQRKRMATVASVYTLKPQVRTPEEILKELRPVQEVTERQERPKPERKRVWASLEKEPEAVLKDAFSEAIRRDPRRQKKWVALVDGNKQQLEILQRMAAHFKVALVIVMDLIHVVEYLWKACWAFFREGEKAAQQWVDERLLEVLRGKASQVAGAIRRSATLRGLTGAKRKAVDTCANYLLNHKQFLRYDEYLAAGLPIATGVAEGACRYLVKDRLEVTGARWSLKGAEAVLKLRSLKASDDFEAYWRFHLKQEHQRHHVPLYAQLPGAASPSATPSNSGHLRIVT